MSTKRDLQRLIHNYNRRLQWLKEQLALFGDRTGMALEIEDIEEKLEQIEKKIFVEKMKQAYQGLAHENLKISEDFKYVDTENLQ